MPHPAATDLPVATILAATSRNRPGYYVVRVACPFCHRQHAHGVPPMGGGVRLSDCSPGGQYRIEETDVRILA